MPENRSLFSLPVARPSSPATARRSQEAHGFRRLSRPVGKADKRGKFPYEKFHAAAMGISEPARIKFFDLLLVTDATLLSHIIEIGVLWNRLSVTDQLDYEDAIRLRG